MTSLTIYVCNNKNCGHISTETEQQNGTCRKCGLPGVGIVDYNWEHIKAAAARVYNLSRPEKPEIENEELRDTLNRVALRVYDHLPQTIYDAQWVLASFLDKLSSYVPDLPSRLRKFQVARLAERDILSIVFEIAVCEETIVGAIDENSTEIKIKTEYELNPFESASITQWVSKLNNALNNPSSKAKFF